VVRDMFSSSSGYRDFEYRVSPRSDTRPISSVLKPIQVCAHTPAAGCPTRVRLPVALHTEHGPGVMSPRLTRHGAIRSPVPSQYRHGDGSDVCAPSSSRV
jgi:hypothetical protein